MQDPIFRSSPALEVGMPVLRANCCFAFAMPNARFHEKERPGMGVDFFAITFSIRLIPKTYPLYLSNLLSEGNYTYLQCPQVFRSNKLL